MSNSPKPGGFASGPYLAKEEIEKQTLIAKGQYGSVWKGRVRAMDVAVKVPLKQTMSQQNLLEFKKEVQIMSEIYHPNVCLFMGASLEVGHINIVSELMEGSLTKLLKSPKDYPLSTRMNWALEAAKGVSWLHANKPPVIHMDLKPDNILYDSNLRIKVCDFGLSRFKEGTKAYIRQPVGTPLYMAPEIMEVRATNPTQVSEKVDVYSFGIILWEILTKKDAFANHNNYIMFTRAVRAGERPPIPVDCPPSLRTLMNQCWDGNGSDRPPFTKIVKDLELIVQQCEEREREEYIERHIPDAEGARFWKSNFIGTDSVNWKAFMERLWIFLGLPVPELESSETRNTKADDGDDADGYESCSMEINEETRPMWCLRALLCGDSEDVTLLQFGKILGWFGPLQTPHIPGGTLDRIVDLLEMSSFHGFMTGSEASALLRTYPAGSYLIRFSANHQKSYCISRSDGSGVRHLVVPYDCTTGVFTLDNKQYTNLKHLIISERERFNLGHACPCDKYSWLFDSKFSTASGYVDNSDDIY